MVEARGPVTVITGAAGSIGGAAARYLVGNGHDVVLLDRDARGLAAICETVQRIPDRRIMSFALDVADRPAIGAALAEADRTLGGITGLFSNAGVGRWAPVQELSVDDWLAVLETNLHGTINLCQAALPHMLAGEGGAIVIMSSDLAIVGRSNYSAYCAAKAALYGLTKALAVEFAPQVRVNAVGPGPIDTPHLRSGRSGAEWQVAVDRYLAGIPAGRLGQPDDVAPVVEFLLSERSAHIAGQMIQPNGGQVMW